jgi:hypothetical protein
MKPHETATLTELLTILFIAALFICGLAAIVSKEKIEAEWHKTWEK